MIKQVKRNNLESSDWSPSARNEKSNWVVRLELAWRSLKQTVSIINWHTRLSARLALAQVNTHQLSQKISNFKTLFPKHSNFDLFTPKTRPKECLQVIYMNTYSKMHKT